MGRRNRTIGNVVGKRFGRWTVIDQYYSKDSKRKDLLRCKCICDCQQDKDEKDREIKDVTYNSIQQGKSQSCGCLQRETVAKLKGKDYTGMTFGRWTALERIPVSKEFRYVRYLCQCSCKDKTIKIVNSNSLAQGLSTSCGCYQSEATSIRSSGENNNYWKGGVTKRNLALYDTYAPQLEPIEECRRDPEESILLQVQCSLCKSWLNPTMTAVWNRVRCINGKMLGEARFYCCEEHKAECGVYRQILYPKGYLPEPERDPHLQAEFREMVLERDNYECQRCGSNDNLEAHHIYGILYSPLESCDIDDATTFCHSCHKLVHKEKGCTYKDLQCNK